MEKILETELRALGIDQLKRRRAGVDCPLELEQIYRVCLWSRVANRVLYPLTAFKVVDEKQYYRQLLTIDWSEHLGETGTVAVDFFSADSVITHSQYGAQLTKDAVVDWFREKTSQRPNVDREKPDVRINVYLFKNRARVSLDMAGSSLHRRNYRQQGGIAPLKENLAAAILLAARWPVLAARGAPLYDPMCGSGTLLIEAGLIAANRPPGGLRDYFGFTGWRRHQPELWQQVLDDARQVENRWLEDSAKKPLIRGADVDQRAVTAARNNIAAANLSDLIEVECEDFYQTSWPLSAGPGLLVTNPPYGERLEDNDQIAGFYSQLGRSLKRRAPNWTLALFTGKPVLFHRTGLSRRSVLECTNGGIDCKLLMSEIPPLANAESTGRDATDANESVAEPVSAAGRAGRGESDSSPPGIEQFTDRLRKNLKQLKGWAKSAGVTNYRIYDADLPDYAIAVDVFGFEIASGPFVCVQEYKAPTHIDPVLAQQRLQGAVATIAELLQCKPENLAVKRRERQRGESQYQRLHKQQQMIEVSESECRVLINLHDYLDAGLFLDHRKVRQWIGKSSGGKRFLNLYCYTAVATLHAALGGADSSISVDLSHKYLEWADKNYQLNGIDREKHQLVHADCDKWLGDYSKSMPSSELQSAGFDLIFLDPPTFSNSTSMDSDWNVQGDHGSMIDRCMAILKIDGTLIFSNNFRRFKLSEDVSDKYRVEDRTKWSLQRDFSRNPRIHQCWFIQHKPN